MSTTTHQAKMEKVRQRVFCIRHQVYAEEMQRRQTCADSTKRTAAAACAYRALMAESQALFREGRPPQ